MPCLDAIELPSLFAIEDRKIISSVGNYIYKCMRGQNVIDNCIAVTVIVLNTSPYVFLCSNLT